MLSWNQVNDVDRLHPINIAGTAPEGKLAQRLKTVRALARSGRVAEFLGEFGIIRQVTLSEICCRTMTMTRHKVYRQTRSTL